MLAASCPEILGAAGFGLIGQINYRLSIQAWWNPAPDYRLQVLLLYLGEGMLLKADKSYFLRSVSEQGETWARDIGPLHDYLEHHFPELRLAFSHFRDVPATLAEQEARRRMSADAPQTPTPSVEQVVQLQQQLVARQRAAQSAHSLASLAAHEPDFLSGYLHQRQRNDQAEIGALEAQFERDQHRLGLLRQLQQEYRRRGSAAVYTFSVSSGLHLARSAVEFRDALSAAVKEVQDQHRYSITQKLQGGRLNIHVAEADEPAVAWIEQWLGGTLSPTQLERLGLANHPAARPAHLIVTPDEPITVNGHVRTPEKRLAARVTSTFLSRLDKTGADNRDKELRLPATAQMPLRIGQSLDETGRVTGFAVLALTEVVHAAVSGTTGSGKSFGGRVLIEEAAMHEELRILVLDPRNQCAGLLVPEDRPEVLRHFSQFGMDAATAHGFPFEYIHAAGLNADELPTLAKKRAIISFKGMDDGERCDRAAEILNSVFDAIGQREAERPRLLVVVDEAHLFTRKRVEAEAKDAAARVGLAIDRFAREGRKFGGVMILISQSMRDTSHDLASVRQMTATKIFFRNADREIDYAADFIGEGRKLIHLRTGEAIVHNAAWGVQRVRLPATDAPA